MLNCKKEKKMATRSSVLAWRIPGTGEPGGLPSLGLPRVWHDWNDLAGTENYVYSQDSQGSASGKEPACQRRRHKRRVWSLVPEDPQEESIATYSSILAWRILRTKKSGGPLSMRWQSPACLKQLSLHTHTQNKKRYSFFLFYNLPSRSKILSI